MRNAFIAGDVEFAGAGGDLIPGYAALPQESRRTGGVVVIHHMPGFDWGSKEIVRRFASWGFAAAAPNLHHREAPGADPDDAAAATRAAGGVPDERLTGDVAGARDFLLDLASTNRRTAAIGFCSGGRQAVLAGCRIPFDAAIDCYGAFVLDAPPPERGSSVTGLAEALPDLGCPLLGVFGNEDQHPSPDEVDRLDALLGELGKPHEFHRFDDAGHAFLAADRPSYRQPAAVQAWELVRSFLNQRIGGEG